MNTLRALALAALVCGPVESRTLMAQRRPSAPEKAPPAKVDTLARNEAFFQALIFQAQEDARVALDYYLKALKLDATHTASAYGAAQCYFVLEDYDQSLAYARQARQADEQNVWYWQLEASALEGQKQYTRAVAVLADATKRFPAMLDLQFRLAELYVVTGRPAEALQLYDQLEQRTGLVEEIGLHKHRLFLQTRQPEQAVAVMRRLITQFPRETRLYQLLYETYRLQGRSDDATDVLQEMTRELPPQPFVLLELSRTYAERGQRRLADSLLYTAARMPNITPEELTGYMEDLFTDYANPVNRATADRLLLIMRERFPDHTLVKALLAQWYEQGGAADSARQVYRAALEIDPTDAETWVALLELDRKQEQWPDLYNDALAASEVFPNQVAVQVALAWGALRMGKLTEVAPALNRVLKLQLSDSRLQAEVYTALAEAHFFMGQMSEAALAAENALRAAPGDADIQGLLALVTAAEGSAMPKAKRLAQDALAQEPADRHLQMAAAWVEFRGGDAAALQRMEAAYAAQATVMGAYLVGLAYSQQRDNAQAITWWRKGQRLAPMTDWVEVFEKKIAAI